MAKSAYKRILLKVSGEVLAGDQSFGIEPKFLHQLADQIADVAKSGVEVAVVIGAGNIFRGMAVAAKGGDRVTSDLMGMLGTVINSLALGDAIEQKGLKVKIYSNVPMETVADTFTARDARRCPLRGQCRDLRRRHRQPVLHHRHRGGAEGDRTALRRAAQGHQGGRRLFGRSQEESRARSATRRSAMKR